jgi:hypothetical protein
MGKESGMNDKIPQKQEMIGLISKTHPQIEIKELSRLNNDLKGGPGEAYPALWGMPPVIFTATYDSLSHEEWITIVAHELGHHIIGMPLSSFTKRMSLYSMALIPFFITKRQPIRKLIINRILSILQEEQAAWNAGFQYLREHGFEITEDMRSIEKLALSYYGNNYREKLNE